MDGNKPCVNKENSPLVSATIMGSSNLPFWVVNYNCHVHMTEQITSTSRKLAQKYICAVKRKYAFKVINCCICCNRKQYRNNLMCINRS